MQTYLPSSTLPRAFHTPVRDEEAESQRKARSRQARQTRRSTQGVTLTELKEAQRSYGPDCKHAEEDEAAGKTGSAEDQPLAISLTKAVKSQELSPAWSQTDEEGNVESRLEAQAECPAADQSNASPSGLCSLPDTSITNSKSWRVSERWRTDENQNPIHDADQLSADTSLQAPLGYDMDLSESSYTQHDRLSRLDSGGSGDSTTEKLLGRVGSYTRRETRLASQSKPEEGSATGDYKKMYETALNENDKLKSRLRDSKQELAKIRSQLDKVTQKQDRMSERPPVLESDKKEKQALEKRVSDMEEELKVLVELKSENQRLKDENGALIRVISKLSK
ncbi:protein phosphatase 1 regulatory subunit 12B isoform X1 [Gadus morhua]|uniref:protein phosphatase 1 regulatory subunit 12B isoform X1 n=1 Tax=Gadus morhua TaxID=8049 RepID=UPI0011B7F9CB|nr:protein phosphatase 1 regulatory subunit 12B-like isoform X1 [Gadus morhua]